MEATAKLRFARGSARKARLVLDQIRYKSVPEAQGILQFAPGRGQADRQAAGLSGGQRPGERPQARPQPGLCDRSHGRFRPPN